LDNHDKIRTIFVVRSASADTRELNNDSILSIRNQQTNMFSTDDDFGLRDLENQFKNKSKLKISLGKKNKKSRVISKNSVNKHKTLLESQITLDNTKSKSRKNTNKSSKKKSATKPQTGHDTKRSQHSVSKNKENINFINQNILNVSSVSAKLRTSKPQPLKDITRNNFNEQNLLTASFNHSGKAKLNISKTLQTPDFPKKVTLSNKINDSIATQPLNQKIDLTSSDTILKMISSLQKQKPKSKPLPKYIKDYQRTKSNCINFKDISLLRK